MGHPRDQHADPVVVRRDRHLGALGPQEEQPRSAQPGAVPHRSRWASLFLFLQAYEYHHAYTELNLKLTTGAYGATFFMLTGFHGFHVTLGTIMLIVILVRS